MVFKRHNDDKGRGQKPRIESDAITSIRDALDIDLRLTVLSLIATMAYVSIWTVFMVSTEYLHMSNVYATCMMKDSEKEKRVGDSKSFLQHYEKECALSMKQSGVPIEHYRIHPNNSPPHTATSTLLELDVLGFGVDHFPYSPDLAPFEFYVYPKVKSQLKGRRFSSLSKLHTASANIILQYNQDWSRVIFNKWVKLHQKCLAYNGEYFEKK